MPVSLNLVVAACTNRGIGIKGRLPWKLGADMAFFKKITSYTNDTTRKNAVLMGRKTWDSIPAKFRPLPNRINVIISSTLESSAEGDVFVARSFEAAVRLLSSATLSRRLERVFVIGGESVYKAALESGLCERIYLTQVLQEFECDAFMPEFNPKIYQPVQEPDVNCDVQTDGTSHVLFKFTVCRRIEQQPLTASLIVDAASLPPVPLHVSIAIDSDRGFGRNGLLPWSLKIEFDYFINLISNTSEPGKKVAVVKGRKTWQSTLEIERNLPSVVNIVISRTMDEQSTDDKFYVVKSFDEALQVCHGLVQNGTVEKTWVLGGRAVYQVKYSFSC
jgi:dihydrofolate reductase